MLQAEARLAAKRAARAEAREIRMKELERQQKEVTRSELPLVLSRAFALWVERANAEAPAHLTFMVRAHLCLGLLFKVRPGRVHSRDARRASPRHRPVGSGRALPGFLALNFRVSLLSENADPPN